MIIYLIKSILFIFLSLIIFNSAYFEHSFLESREKDVMTQRTNIGSHKDDYTFLMDGQPLKKFGSQGQQKSFLIALRLSQYDYLAKVTQKKPMLLLDDVFDKLDDERVERITKLLTDTARFGQVFITDARKERTSLLVKNKYRVQEETKEIGEVD